MSSLLGQWQVEHRRRELVSAMLVSSNALADLGGRDNSTSTRRCVPYCSCRKHPHGRQDLTRASQEEKWNTSNMMEFLGNSSIINEQLDWQKFPKLI